MTSDETIVQYTKIILFVIAIFLFGIASIVTMKILKQIEENTSCQMETIYANGGSI